MLMKFMSLTGHIRHELSLYSIHYVFRFKLGLKNVNNCMYVRFLNTFLLLQIAFHFFAHNYYITAVFN
jgi:hypothetical protein